MLVLGRKLNEKIIINENIIIEISKSVNNKYFTLLLDAPEDIKIWRDEIYQRIKFEKFNSNQEMINATTR